MALNPSTNATMSGRITAADANYPYGSSKDETTPGAGDGTPYFKARADDIFGLQQSLLDEANIVPSGNADNKGTSQYKEAIRTIMNMRTTTHDMASDADYTLTDAQNRKRRVVITDTGVVLTTGRDIVVDDMEKRFIAVNETAQTLTFIIAGAGVDVLAGETVDLINDGTDIIAFTLSLETLRFTPTFTAITNLSAVTASPCNSSRVGDTVTFSGAGAVNPVATGAIQLRVSLPFASNFTAGTHASGVVSNSAGAIIGVITADTANDEILLSCDASVTANTNISFTCQYVIV